MDIYQRNGGYALPPGAPDTLGVEFSGIVAELGESCGQRWKVGDEVFGLASGVSATDDKIDPPSHDCLRRGILGSLRRIHPGPSDTFDAQACPFELGRSSQHT